MANAPFMHKGAPLPTFCLLCITVPRQGQKSHILGQYIEETCPFPEHGLTKGVRFT